MQPFPPGDQGPLTGGDDPPPADPPPWRERGEQLAVLLVVATVGIVGQALFNALAVNEQFRSQGGAGAAGLPSDWDVLLPLTAQGGTILGALPLAVALALVVLPAGPVGRAGRLALNGLSVVGVVVAALALLGVEETLRGRAGGPFSPLGVDEQGTSRAVLFTKIGGVFTWIPPALLAGSAAWMAWRALNDDDAEPLDEIG